MRHRYSYLDPELIRQLLSEMGLRRLFNHLLLQSGGDVDEAMRWMRALQERGYIDPNIDLEAFFARLVEENILGQDADGNVVLAAGGERQIRRDALDEIFSGLQKAMKTTDPKDAILMTEDDLEVFETEHNSSCATVVMIDISHSMVLYGE